MKKIIRATSLIALAVVLTLGVFAIQAQARDHGKHNGLLMDPILIEEGYISGTVFGDPDDPVRIYRGIPYAAPPVGEWRWKPPQPAEPWDGIRECVDFSINPVQFAPGRYFPIGDPESEDCLYLNVLTPARHTNEKLPVMVWFHGGGLAGSAGNQIDWNRHRLPQHGVVVVTVNMRLGALGLLAHPALTVEGGGISGNYLFLDMIASLEWVQRNIAAFGGNPDKVTIFGESGGGWKVTAMLTSPLAAGLFHRAMIQSGAGLEPAPLDVSEDWGAQFFDQLGVTTLEDARAKTWQELVDAYVALPGAQGFGTTLDGYVFPDTPLNVFSSGDQNAVPLIVQACQGELNGFPSMPHVSYGMALFEGNRNLGVDSWAAIFDQVPANWRDAGIVSFHAMDLAYTFGLYDEPEASIWVQMAGRTGLPGNPLALLAEGDKIVSEDMMTRFARFAETGNPNPPGCKSKHRKSKHSDYWPAWTPSGDQYIYWNEGSQILSGFSGLQ